MSFSSSSGLASSVSVDPPLRSLPDLSDCVRHHPPLSFLLDNKLDTFGSTLHLANSAQRVVLQQILHDLGQRLLSSFQVKGTLHYEGVCS